jgi:hypothetical protein
LLSFIKLSYNGYVIEFLREVKMKKAYTKVTEVIAQFVRWIVVGVLWFLVALPIITSIQSSA